MTHPTIQLQGASYPDVPSVVLPVSGGGTASFTDVTDTTAAASDVAQGKYFHLATGERVQGGLADGDSIEYGITDGTLPLAGVAKAGYAVI